MPNESQENNLDMNPGASELSFQTDPQNTEAANDDLFVEQAKEEAELLPTDQSLQEVLGGMDLRRNEILKAFGEEDEILYFDSREEALNAISKDTGRPIDEIVQKQSGVA